jgi:hypothetical protein
MRWSASVDKRTAEAAIATLRDPVECSLERLAASRYSEWAQTRPTSSVPPSVGR